MTEAGVIPAPPLRDVAETAHAALAAAAGCIWRQGYAVMLTSPEGRAVLAAINAWILATEARAIGPAPEGDELT